MENDPNNPEYDSKKRDAIMDLCPNYDPNHKCGVVRESVFKDCLAELRERERVVLEKLHKKQSTLDTLKEQLKADEKAAYDLRCNMIEISDYFGLSPGLCPAEIVRRLKLEKDDKDDIENKWEELCEAIGAHGPESDPLTGWDTNDVIHKRAMGKIKTMKGTNTCSEVSISREEYEELLRDKARLDYLESAHEALNKRYGTDYGWELIINHNVVRFMVGNSHPRDGFPGIDLHDSKGGYAKLSTCRVAIDKYLPSQHEIK